MEKILHATCDTKLKIPFDCLHGIQGNLREMSKEDFVKLRKSLVDNGMNFASHVWKELAPGPDGEALVKWWIIDGHGRKLVIRHLVEEEGYECEDVPCVEIEALSFDDAKKKVLLAISAYQKTTEEGLYEFMSGLEMKLPDLAGYELPGVDLAHFEASYFEDPKISESENDVPEPPAVAISRPGDLFYLGPHRLLCGDSTNPEHVARLMGGEKAEACITDPPYSVNYDTSHKSKERGGNVLVHASYNEAGWDGQNAENLLTKFLKQVPSDVLVMSYPVDRHFQALARSLDASDFEFRKELVWVKDQFSFWMGSKYQQRHEPILWCAKKGKPMGGEVPADQSTVLEFPRPKAHELHPTAKPVALWELLVRHHTTRGGLVYEPFAGSGTTFVAAEVLGRRCFGIEMSPNYVDVILDRWASLTGKDPVRDDGVAWSSLKVGEKLDSGAGENGEEAHAPSAGVDENDTVSG